MSKWETFGQITIVVFFKEWNRRLFAFINERWQQATMLYVELIELPSICTVDCAINDFLIILNVDKSSFLWMLFGHRNVNEAQPAHGDHSLTRTTCTYSRSDSISSSHWVKTGTWRDTCSNIRNINMRMKGRRRKKFDRIEGIQNQKEIYHFMNWIAFHPSKTNLR